MRQTRGIAIALAAGIVASAGCSTTSTFGREKLATSAAPRYVGGRGYAMYPTTPNLTTNIETTMSQLGMRSIHPVPEPNGGSGLEAQTADRRTVRVSIHSTGIRSTVGMKVGWLGDEPLTRSFLDQLENLQGALPASALPDPDVEKTGGLGAYFAKDAVPDAIMQRSQLDPTHNPSIMPAP